MKIAIVHFRIARVGGLETRLLNYVDFFTRYRHDVTVIHAKHDKQVCVPAYVRLVRVDVKWIPKPLRMWWFGNESRRLLKKMEFDFTLSLGRTPFQDFLICPGTHLGFLRSTNRLIKSPVDYLNIKLDQYAFTNSKRILAASKLTSSELVDLYKVPAKKIKVLYPPSDTHSFNFYNRDRKKQLQSLFNMDSNRKNFLFVSSGHARKGLDLMMQTMELLKSERVHLYIAGAPPKRSVPENVTYLGFINQMNLLYTAADGLIHPALYEPFGQVVAESLMCGTPVIISHQTGASELVDAREAIILNSFRTENWSNAIRQFLDTNWTVPENFAQRNGLTIEAHMKEMMAT